MLFRARIFFKFFSFWLPWQPEFGMESKSSKHFEMGLVKFGEIPTVSLGEYHIVDRRMADIRGSQKLTLS